MRCTAIFLCLPSLILSALAPDASDLPVDAVAFQIAESSASSISLRANSDGDASGSAACTFSWDTRGAKAAGGAAAAPASASAVVALLATLSGKCASSVPGADVVFRVCLGAGGVATQSGGSGAGAWTFSLGKLVAGGGVAGAGAPSEVAFSGGDRCGTIERSARAVLHCGETAAVVSAEEPSQCEYSIGVALPELCAMEDVFPRQPARPQYDASASGGALAGPRSANEDYVRTLPTGLRTKLERQLGDARGEKGAPREDAASTATVLDENDVVGTGGGSIGVDDVERHGGAWTGLDANARAVGPQAWTAEVHHADVDAAVAPSSRAWRCAAWSVDDLRRGTEGGGSSATGTSSDPASASLTIWAPKTASPSSPLHITGAVARGINRERLAVHARVADDGASAVVTWTREAASTVDAGAGDEPLRIAFLSVSIEASM